MVLAVGEQAARAALALAGPLRYPRHRLYPVFAQPEKPMIAQAALAVVAVAEMVLSSKVPLEVVLDEQVATIKAASTAVQS